MKNILIVIPSLKKGGGAERVAFDIIKGLKANSNYKIFLNTFYTHTNSYELPIKRMSFSENSPKNAISKVLRLFSRAKKIKDISQKNNIDIIISFVEDANFPSILSKLILRNKSKLIVSTHSSPLTRPWSYRLLMKTLYRKADKVITVSKGIQEILEKKFNIPDYKIETIYNPLNINKINTESSEELSDYSSLGFKSNDFVFISLGRLFKIKNHLGIVKAFNKVIKKYPKTKLVFIGEGPERISLEREIDRNNLNASVFLLGLKSNPFPYLSKGNCFVFNSFSEGFGVSVTEALACDLPIISSNCNFGPREILCKGSKIESKIEKCSNGILVPVNDDDSLSEAMEMIIKNDFLRNKFKKTARKRALDFDINTIIKRWINLIDNI
jgi:glycosyltransferase involved in cell wall biosynthesis